MTNKEIELSPIRFKIFHYIKDAPYQSPLQISRIIGLTPKRTRTIVRDMIQANILKRHKGRGNQCYYSTLPEIEWK